MSFVRTADFGDYSQPKKTVPIAMEQKRESMNLPIKKIIDGWTFYSDEKKFDFRVPWGAWSLRTGKWYPNLRLSMSTEEQHRQNVENGFIREERDVEEA